MSGDEKTKKPKREKAISRTFFDDMQKKDKDRDDTEREDRKQGHEREVKTLTKGHKREVDNLKESHTASLDVIKVTSKRQWMAIAFLLVCILVAVFDKTIGFDVFKGTFNASDAPTEEPKD